MPQPPRMVLYCYFYPVESASGEWPLTFDIEQVSGPPPLAFDIDEENGWADFDLLTPPTEDVVFRLTMTDPNGETVTQDVVFPATGRRVVNQLLTLTDEGWR